MDQRYQNCTLELQNTRLCYAHAPNPGRPVLLALPGYKDTIEGFSLIDPYLLERFEVFLLDWRGHGNSPPVQDGLYCHAGLLYELALFSETVLPRTYWLLGSELGAQIAAAWTGLNPDRVEALVLLEGLMGIYDERALARRLSAWLGQVTVDSQLQATTKRRGFKDLEEVEEALAEVYPTMPSDLYPRTAAQMTRPGEDGRLHWHYAPDLDVRWPPLPLSQALCRALWRNIRSPVLWLYSIPALLEPADRLPGPTYDDEADLALVVKEIISHFRSIEYAELESPCPGLHRTQPEAVARLLRAFEERLGTGDVQE